MKLEPLDRVLTIDPGMNTGWAYWNKFNREPANTGEFKLGDQKIKATMHTTEEQMEMLWSKFIRLVRKYNPIICHIEGVGLWSSSLKSVTAAKTGKLFKLAFLIGGYCRICQQEGVSFSIIQPAQWKGQLNDVVVKSRVLRAINQEYRSPHTTDAVGMGLSLLGDL